MTDPGDRLLQLYARAEAQQRRHNPTPAALRPRRLRATAVMIYAHKWRDVKAFAATLGIPLMPSRDVKPGRYVLAFTTTAGAARLRVELERKP